MKAKRIFAIVFDLLIISSVVFSAVWMFTSIPAYETNGGLDLLKYFTVQSNFLLGLIALIVLPFDILVLLGKRESAPTGLRIAFLVANTGTTITLLTVLFFLGPTLGYGMMFETYNFFMHLLTPLLGMARVLFFETGDRKLRWQVAAFGIVPLAIYGTIYLINIAVHNGYGRIEYDWYGFGKGGLGIGILAFVAMILLAFGITWLFKFGQSKTAKLFHKN